MLIPDVTIDKCGTSCSVPSGWAWGLRKPIPTRTKGNANKEAAALDYGRNKRFYLLLIMNCYDKILHGLDSFFRS
jgi:hypothetical protein